ncbi:MAG: hypothetical protein ACTSWX_09975 [Promethearchaeota archaeon]
MIYYILFGKSHGDLVLKLENTDLINKLALKQNFDPNMLFGMAKALYSMGNELNVGKLKTLDLKNYSIITNANQNNLMALVVENSKRNNSKMQILMEKIPEIFKLFLSYENNNIQNQENIDYLKDLKNSMKNIIPSMKKVIKNMLIKND